MPPTARAVADLSDERTTVCPVSRCWRFSGFPPLRSGCNFSARHRSDAVGSSTTVSDGETPRGTLETRARPLPPGQIPCDLRHTLRRRVTVV